MKNHIKKVSRINLPETNSSSSHSVVICMNEESTISKSEWDLNIDENLILHIPEFGDFDELMFYTNSLQRKLQYLSCFYLGGVRMVGNGPFNKLCNRFAHVISDILGVRGIEYEGQITFLEDLEKGLVEEDYVNDYCYPEIDHQSLDLIEDICESEETIKNFLLNRNSWLYGGSDSIDMSEEKTRYGTVEPSEVIGLFTIESKEFGKIDFELDEKLIVASVFDFLDNAFTFDVEKCDFKCCCDIDRDPFLIRNLRPEFIVEGGKAYIKIETLDSTGMNVNGFAKVPVEFKILDYNALSFV